MLAFCFHTLIPFYSISSQSLVIFSSLSATWSRNFYRMQARFTFDYSLNLKMIQCSYHQLSWVHYCSRPPSCKLQLYMKESQTLTCMCLFGGKYLLTNEGGGKRGCWGVTRVTPSRLVIHSKFYVFCLNWLIVKFILE